MLLEKDAFWKKILLEKKIFGKGHFRKRMHLEKNASKKIWVKKKKKIRERKS